MIQLDGTTRRSPPEALDTSTARSTTLSENLGEVLPQVVLKLLQEADPDIRCPDIGSVADAVGFGVRTLQRRLEREGLNFKRVIDQTRFQTAVRLLVESDARLIDIGYDLGYSDPAHFTRAFRRWTGVSPSAYRSLRRAA